MNFGGGEAGGKQKVKRFRGGLWCLGVLGTNLGRGKRQKGAGAGCGGVRRNRIEARGS